MSRDNDQKHAFITNEKRLQNHSLSFQLSFRKTIHFFQLPAFYFVHRNRMHPVYSNSLMSLISIMWYLHLGTKHILSRWRAVQWYLLAMYFFIGVGRKKGCFSNNLYRSWKWLVKLQFRSGCWVVFWSKEPEKHFFYFLFKLTQIKEIISQYGKVTWQWPKKGISFSGNFKWQWPKKAQKTNSSYLLNQFFSFHCQKVSSFFIASVLSPSLMAYNTTAFLVKETCSDYVDFGKSQDIFDQFLSPKSIPKTWM